MKVLTQDTLREAVDELGGDPLLFVAKDLWWTALRLARAIHPSGDLLLEPPAVYMGDVRVDAGFPAGAWTLGVMIA